jgi:hypothetical protein
MSRLPMLYCQLVVGPAEPPGKPAARGLFETPGRTRRRSPTPDGVARKLSLFPHAKICCSGPMIVPASPLSLTQSTHACLF